MMDPFIAALVGFILTTFLSPFFRSSKEDAHLLRQKAFIEFLLKQNIMLTIELQQHERVRSSEARENETQPL